MKIIGMTISLLLLIYSCQNANPTVTEPENDSTVVDKPITEETWELDSTLAILYDTVGAKHDTAMLLMKDIGQVRSKLRKLMTRFGEEDYERKDILDLLSALKKADDGMMNWMRMFKGVELEEAFYKESDHATIEAYLKEEEAKIEQVHQDMLNSIAEGRAYLKEQKIDPSIK